MRLNANYFFISTICFLLIGCGSPQYKTGDYFFRDIDASGKNPTYFKEGVYQGNDFFVVNPNWQKYEKQAGLLVRGQKVVQSLTQDDVLKIRDTLVSQENQKKASENLKNQNPEQMLQSQKEEFEKKRAEQISKIKSRIDVVAQVLNYSSGCKDQGCDSYTWAAKGQKNCIYEKVELSGGKDNLYGLIQNFSNQMTALDSPAYGTVGTAFNEINLNELDPKSLQIVTMNRIATEQKEIRDPYKVSRIIGYNNIQHKFQTQEVLYMGKPIFSQQNLDIDRLKRGWTLIYSKYCTGIKKAF